MVNTLELSELEVAARIGCSLAWARTLLEDLERAGHVERVDGTTDLWRLTAARTGERP